MKNQQRKMKKWEIRALKRNKQRIRTSYHDWGELCEPSLLVKRMVRRMINLG